MSPYQTKPTARPRPTHTSQPGVCYGSCHSNRDPGHRNDGFHQSDILDLLKVGKATAQPTASLWELARHDRDSQSRELGYAVDKCHSNRAPGHLNKTRRPGSLVSGPRQTAWTTATLRGACASRDGDSQPRRGVRTHNPACMQIVGGYLRSIHTPESGSQKIS